MHRAETGGGQSDEQPGPIAHRLGHGLAAGQAGAYEVEGISGVQS